MNLRWLAMIALTAIVALGCSPARRRDDAYQELLNAEKRWLEDQLYKLDYEYGVLQEKLHSTARENEVLRAALKEARDGDAPQTNRRQDSPFEPSRRPEVEAGGIAPPDVDLGDPSPPTIDLPPITPPGELRQDLPPDGASNAAPVALATDESPAAPYDLVDPRVTHIHLNPLLTGGADIDGKPGDDGVSVVIEPRNAADQYVPVAGPISIVVLDPDQQGEAARVARWDFTVQETREAMERSVFGQGIRLQLPWPGPPPENPRLRLFVRYTAPDGGKLEADREIFVEHPGQPSSRWTPLAPPGMSEQEVGLATHVQVHPGAAQPRMAAAPVLPERTPPPPGPTGSDDVARPVWKPHR